MKLINYRGLAERRRVIVDTLESNRDRYEPGSSQYQRLSTLIGEANLDFTHAVNTGDTENFDSLEANLVGFVNDVHVPLSERDPEIYREAQKILDSCF